MTIQIKRAYDPPEPEDGYRILVDRLWPRGLAKAEAHLDLWLREVAPTHELRRWFGHEPAKWADFQRRYAAELAAPDAASALARLRALAAERTVTLLHAAADRAHNNAVALRDHLIATTR